MFRKLFEALLRPLLRAPKVEVDLVVDDSLPDRWVVVRENDMAVIGLEDGGHATANGSPVRVMTGDEPACNSATAQRVGTGSVVVRRRVLSVLVREVWALSWTLVGMAMVLITLSGDAQRISASFVLLGMVLHTMTLRLPRTPRK